MFPDEAHSCWSQNEKSFDSSREMGGCFWPLSGGKSTRKSLKSVQSKFDVDGWGVLPHVRGHLNTPHRSRAQGLVPLDATNESELERMRGREEERISRGRGGGGVWNKGAMHRPCPEILYPAVHGAQQVRKGNELVTLNLLPNFK